MFSTWGNTQEVGWVRHAFDKFEVPFDLIYKERVRQGGLRSAYDVIVIPNQGRGSAKSLVFDVESKGKPLAYKKSDSYTTLGVYGESDDITGGMGLEGVVELQKFVNDGGVLITLAASSYLPPEYGLARNVNAQRPTPQFYAPGPIVEAEIVRADASDLLRLRRQEDSGALRQRSAAAGAADRRRAGPDAVSGRRCGGPERPHEKCQ